MKRNDFFVKEIKHRDN